MDKVIEKPETQTEQNTARPAHIPEKFWDADKNAPRLDALLKSYSELEKRLSQLPTPPQTPEDYQIALKHQGLEIDPEVNRKLHQAGFNQSQAQLVYDLAVDYLVPVIDAVRQSGQIERETVKLVEHFGGADQWQEASRQIMSWAERNLPPQAVEALSNDAEGVLVLEQMMRAAEPKLGRNARTASDEIDEPRLRAMMNDKRYWKTRDPDWIAKVEAGYRKLYGKKV